MENWKFWVLATERGLLLIAACLAVLPLLQFYGERDQRRIDRVASFISMGVECEDVQAEMEEGLGAAGPSKGDESLFENGITRRSIHVLCRELGAYLADDDALIAAIKNLEETPSRLVTED